MQKQIKIMQKSKLQGNDKVKESIANTLKRTYKNRVQFAKKHGVKMTQQVTAKKLGMSQSLLSQYFNGDLPIPEDKLSLLCSYLRVELEDLPRGWTRGGEPKLFVLNSGGTVKEWTESAAYFEEKLVHKSEFLVKFTGDVVLSEDGEVLYKHGGALQAFLHLCLTDAMTEEQLENVKVVCCWEWDDLSKRLPGKCIFMKKETWSAKKASGAFTDLKRFEYGPMMALFQIILR